MRSPGAVRTETVNTASSSLDDSMLLAKLHQTHAKIAALEDQLSSSLHSRASGSSGSGDHGDRHQGSPHGSASRRSDGPGARAPTRPHRSDRQRREEQTQRDQRAERYAERLEDAKNAWRHNVAKTASRNSDVRSAKTSYLRPGNSNLRTAGRRTAGKTAALSSRSFNRCRHALSTWAILGKGPRRG